MATKMKYLRNKFRAQNKYARKMEAELQKVGLHRCLSGIFTNETIPHYVGEWTEVKQIIRQYRTINL